MAGGRRVVYPQTLLGRARRLVDEWGPDTVEDAEALVRVFFTLCGRDQLAHRLGVTREQLEQEARSHPMLDETVKRWETKRNACFYRLLPHFKSNAALLQMLNRSWLEAADRATVTGDSAHPTVEELSRAMDTMTDAQLRRIARGGDADADGDGAQQSPGEIGGDTTDR